MIKVKKFRLLALTAITVLAVGVSAPLVVNNVSHGSIVYAWDDNNNGQNSQDNGTVDRTDKGNISDELKGYRPVKTEDIQNARNSSKWLTDLIGVAISFILIATYAAIGLITALDLAYIAVPFVRGFLYTAGTDGTGGVSGMSMNGSTSVGGRQWVSDEAVMVSSMLGGSAQANGHMVGGAPGVLGSGGFGGPAVGMGAQSSSVQQNGGKSPIRTYLGKRLGFLIFLGIATVLLFTSAFTDFGINVGGLILQVLSIVAEKLQSIHF